METCTATNTRKPRPIYSVCSKIENISPRRLKKRETDRRCQREARERTKAYIAYLEEQVENFQHHDAIAQVTALSQRLRAVEVERDAMAMALYTLQSTFDAQQLFIYPYRIPFEASPSRPEVVPAKANYGLQRAGTSATHLPPPTKIRLALTATEMALPKGFHEANLDAPQASADFGDFGPSDSSRPLTVSAALNTGTDDPGCRSSIWQKSLWRFACEVLNERFSWSEDIQPADDVDSDDIPIRALIQGWHVVRRKPLHPSWTILSRIDEALFWPIPKPERLAMLKAMHLLLQFQLQPSFERFMRLPVWYRYRPSQGMSHTDAIDFFAWPGFRERFIFDEHAYSGNDFWDLYQRNLNLLWPHKFEDCFVVDAHTGLFKTTSNFDNTINDINCWTMQPDFFSRFPELYSEIPGSNSIPRFLPAATFRKRFSPMPSNVDIDDYKMGNREENERREALSSCTRS